MLAEKPTFNHSHYVKVDDFEQEKEDWINGHNETFIDQVQEDLDYDNDYNSGFDDFEDSEIVTYSTLGIAVLALVIASVTACFVLKTKFETNTSEVIWWKLQVGRLLLANINLSKGTSCLD